MRVKILGAVANYVIVALSKIKDKKSLLLKAAFTTTEVEFLIDMRPEITAMQISDFGVRFNKELLEKGYFNMDDNKDIISEINLIKDGGKYVIKKKDQKKGGKDVVKQKKGGKFKDFIWVIIYRAVVILFLLAALNDTQEIKKKIEHIEENFTVEGSK